MKNKIFTGIAILVLCVTSVAVYSAETKRAFNDYDIVKLTGQEMEEGAEKAWVLSYDDNESTIVISLHQTKRCKYYVVRTENFEIAYTCGKKGFGASYVNSEYSRVPFELSSKVINESELNRQKILTQSQPTDENAVELIAAYLPDLVNPSYQHLLN
jgi:hypothetical protein